MTLFSTPARHSNSDSEKLARQNSKKMAKKCPKSRDWENEIEY